MFSGDAPPELELEMTAAAHSQSVIVSSSIIVSLRFGCEREQLVDPLLHGSGDPLLHESTAGDDVRARVALEGLGAT